MSKILKVSIIVIVVIIAGSVYHFKNDLKMFYGRSGPSREFTVVLGSDGFEPESLTISKGDTVIFKTSSGKPFWPASDLHPTHGIYPEFDPKQPVEADGSWAFTFNKVGTWKYHDHLFSSYRGKIIVEDKKDVVSAYSITDCENSTAKQQCWEDQIGEVVNKNGLNTAFELVADLYVKEPEFAANCHSFTHILGIAAYRKFAKDKNVELSPKTHYCGYGFYHGFMETLLQEGEDIERAREFCAYVGKELIQYTSDAEGACYHGIGHGTVDGGDPRAWGDPQKMIEPGIKLCEQVSGKREYLYRCVTGVFNAIEILSTDSKYKLTMIKDDPFWLCPSQPNEYKEGCYTNMLPALFRFTNNDFEKMAKIVDKIPSTGDKETLSLLNHTVRGMVTLSLFYDYIMLNLKEPDYNIDKGVAICRSIKSDLRLSCIEGLAGGYMKFGEPEKEYVKGLAFCGSNRLREDEKSICYEYILVRLRLWYTSDKAKMICGEVPEQYKRFCGI